jgi:branched-chain amino acid transport system substrate-binding protein
MKNTEKLLRRKVLLGLASLSLVCTYGAAQAQSQEPIKIGIALVASGPMADYWGRQLVKPAQMAIDDFNANGGVNGRKVVWVLEDNRGDATTGASVARKLINVDKVSAIFSAPTPPTLATLPIAENAKVLVLSAAQNPKIALSPWGSLVPPPAEKSGVAFAKLAVALKAQRVAMMAVDNDAVATASAAFKDAMQKAGIPVVAHETFKTGTQNFTGQLTKMRATNPDFVQINSFSAAEYGYALKQMGELNFKPKNIEAWNPVTDPQARKIAGDLVNGVYYIRLPIDPEWARSFKQRTGYDPDSNAAISYDAVTIYLQARAAAKTDDPVKIRDSMFNYKNYRGALGRWGFKGNGESNVEYEAAQLKADGTAVVVSY